MRYLLTVPKDNIPLAELVLRIITGKKDLIITDCETQKDMKRLGGARSVCLDAYGTDPDMKKYDLETQRADKGAESIEQGIVYGFAKKYGCIMC